MRIQVEGLGELEFPDGMSREAMEQAIMAHPGLKAQPARAVIPDPAQVMGGAGGQVPSIMEMIGQGVKKHLPTAGMMVGGAIGAPAGPLGAAAGAGLGAGILTGARQLIDYFKSGEIPEAPVQEQLMAVPQGATAEMGGQVAGKLLQGAFAPGRKWLETQIGNVEMNRAAQEVAAQGVPISPKTMAPSLPARAVHWLAERFQPGKAIVDSYRKQSMDMIMQMRRDLVEDLGLPAVGSMPLGQAQGEIKNVFKNFREALGPDVKVPLSNTASYVANLTEENVGKRSLEYIDKLKESLKAGTASLPEIERMNAGLWPKGKAYSKMSPLDRNWRDEFLQNLYKDLSAHETSVGLNLADMLKQSKGTAREIYQAQFIERLLDKATNNEALQFNPQFFYDLVQRNQTPIMRQLDKDTATNLFAFANKMKAVAPERALFQQSQLPLSWWEQAVSSGPAVGLAGGAGATMNPAMAIPLGFQAIVARSLMAPKGVVRKWLTTGYTPPTLPIKVGIMESQQ